MVACSDNDNPTKEDSIKETSTDEEQLNSEDLDDAKKSSIDEVDIEPGTKPFSWAEHENKYVFNNSGADVRAEGFENTIASPITQKEDAIETAKNEATVEYNVINVYYDEKSDMWMVLFCMADVLGGEQYVYIDKDGLTRLIVYEE